MRTEVVKRAGIELFATTAGDRSAPALVLLHGWPHDGSLYDQVIDILGRRFFTIAFDLPAVGRSRGAPPSAEKAALADLVLDAADSLRARQPVIAGIDVGGMIAFSAARNFPDRISGAAIGNTVVPGVDPWKKVIADPRIFHFALHSYPGLPEALVSGRERRYFDFFFDFLGHKERPLPDEVRDRFTRAYERPEALTAGFDWYRAFADDARQNEDFKRTKVPILYFRGDADGRTPDEYVDGLRRAGAEHVTSQVLTDTAEFGPIERPDVFAKMIEAFGVQCFDHAMA
jgi:pimeloyl-ACP methyl ester carboxylesterase